MPWKETSPVVEKIKFIGLAKSELTSMSEACERFGISRKTGYKWLERFDEDGPSGLEERSRAPKKRPWAMSASIRVRLLKLKKARPTWGPRKLLAWFRLKKPSLKLPAPSSVGDMLKREGLVDSRKRQQHVRPRPTAIQEPDAPNGCWCVDFKGHFRLKTGQLCYPLTVTDAFSRALIGCEALSSTAAHLAKPALERLFREYGLPEAIRSDNGVPFASNGLGGLSSLSAWWIRLGIRLERIPPGRPQYNGRHERMHRTLGDEVIWPPARSMREQQKRFDAFRPDFNTERPHAGIGNQVPWSLYKPSERPFPEEVPEPTYPQHFERRLVKAGGSIQISGRMVYLSIALANQTVGLERFGDELWRAYFGSWPLGLIDARKKKVRIIAAT